MRLPEIPRFVRSQTFLVLEWLQGYREDWAKLARYALPLQEFSYRIEHCPGKANLLSDYLSRNPELEEPADDRIAPLT